MDGFGPKLREMEATGGRPADDVNLCLISHQILAARMGPGSYLCDYNLQLPGGLIHDQFDHFHEVCFSFLTLIYI